MLPFVVLFTGGLLACTGASATPDADRVALEAAMQRWMTAVNAKDPATLAATMTEDVELLDDAAAVSGREAAARALQESATRGRLVATSREITIEGDVAWRVVALSQAEKNVQLPRGQALEIWKRVNGEWKLHRRMTSGASPEVSLTRPSTRDPMLDQPPRR